MKPKFTTRMIWLLKKVMFSIIYLFTDKVLYRTCSFHYATFPNCKGCKSTYWSKPCKTEILPHSKDGTYSYWPHLQYLANEYGMAKKSVDSIRSE